VPTGTSKLGGSPDVPVGFLWPANGSRPLDFLLQIDLAEAARYDATGLLPGSGLLSFLYDLEMQPWGYDPRELQGFRATYTPDGTPLERRPVPHPDCALDGFGLTFSAGLTLPVFGSRDFERLEASAGMADVEASAYFKFASRLSAGPGGPNCPRHRLLGHADNIQDDMQLEAQLVTNGLYCGEPSGYHAPRARALEAGTDDWILLLQLDSDDKGGFMWGDCGMLYWWIRRQDLRDLRFERAWVALQCY
jgi:uncharacterized protein YwqG